jgi:hypothetical protein
MERFRRQLHNTNMQKSEEMVQTSAGKGDAGRAAARDT